MCGMVKPSFIPPADISALITLVRYRFKLTCMITSEKNRAKNCLTLSNLKLDDVFLMHLVSLPILLQNRYSGEKFDISPFVDCHCKFPIVEIQVAIDSAISKEHSMKLRQCFDHIDELQKHIPEVE